MLSQNTKQTVNNVKMSSEIKIDKNHQMVNYLKISSRIYISKMFQLQKKIKTLKRNQKNLKNKKQSKKNIKNLKRNQKNLKNIKNQNQNEGVVDIKNTEYRLGRRQFISRRMDGKDDGRLGGTIGVELRRKAAIGKDMTSQRIKKDMTSQRIKNYSRSAKMDKGRKAANGKDMTSQRKIKNHCLSKKMRIKKQKSVNGNKTNRKCLNIIQWNWESKVWDKKKEELERVIHQFQPDISLVTEANRNLGRNDYGNSINGYNIHLPEVLLAREGINMEIRKDVMEAEVAAVWFRVEIKGRKLMTVGTFYWKFRYLNDENETTHNDESQLQRFMKFIDSGKKAATPGRNVHVIGDFNIDHLKWNDPEAGIMKKMMDKMEDEVETLGFRQVVREFTIYWNMVPSSLIDHFWMNMPGQTDNTLPQRYLVNGQSISRQVEMAVLQNDYYKDKIEKLVNMIKTPTQDLMRLLKIALEKWEEQDAVPIFKFRQITKDETLTLIRCLGNSGATGHKCLDSIVIKSREDYLWRPSQHMIMISVKTSKFTNPWKLAKVVPRLKSRKLDKYITSSYRSVAISPVLSKSTERTEQQQLLDFLERMGQINGSNQAYRKNYGTTTTSAEVDDEIYEAMEDRKKSSRMTANQSSALDTTHHLYLIEKLRHYNRTMTGWMTIKEKIRLETATFTWKIVYLRIPRRLNNRMIVYLRIPRRLNNRMMTQDENHLIQTSEPMRLNNRMIVYLRIPRRLNNRMMTLDENHLIQTREPRLQLPTNYYRWRAASQWNAL